MSLKTGKVNSLNILKLRRVQFPANHFYFTKIYKYSPYIVKHINRWIYHNMNGRYYIGQGIDLINNQFLYVTKIGFEQEKELTYFSLAYTFEE